MFQAGLDGWLRWYYRKNGVNYPAGEKKLEKPLYDNYTYAFCTVLQGACMEVFIDGESILQWQDDTYRRGTIGFYQTTEKWAMVSRLEVTSGERLLLREDFSADPSARYQYTYSRPFLADGAKRDRLPWSGDLDWAGRNVYYAFSDTRYMLESLRMFARHQTPEDIFGAYAIRKTRSLSKAVNTAITNRIFFPPGLCRLFGTIYYSPAIPNRYPACI